MQDIRPFTNWASNWHRPTWFSSSWLGVRVPCGPGFHESNTVTTPVVGSRLHPITSLSSCTTSTGEMQMRERFLLGKAWPSPTLVKLCHLQSICETVSIFHVRHRTSTYIIACEGLPYNVLHYFSLTNTYHASSFSEPNSNPSCSVPLQPHVKEVTISRIHSCTKEVPTSRSTKCEQVVSVGILLWKIGNNAGSEK